MLDFSLNFNLFNNYYFIYERLIVILFSLVPSIILVGIVLYSDRKSKEPTKNIIICLLSGILTIALAKYVEELVMPYFANNIILTYVWAGIEEFSKIAIFMLFIFDNKHYDDIYDGVVYMTLIALSFAGLENLMYAFSESTISDSISLALMRDFTTIPLHVVCGIIIGYFMSLSNFSKIKSKKIINMVLAFVLPAFIHGTFNVLMNLLSSFNIDYNNMLQVFFALILPLLLIVLIIIYLTYKFCSKAIKLNKTFIDNSNYDDKHNYLMTYDDYEDSTEKNKRIKFYKMTTLNRSERK